jgi:hypothetical protein
MKNRLYYQMTDFDCGPVTLLNAVNYLFEREEIPPELVRNIFLFTLDGYGASGVRGEAGTTAEAMNRTASWLSGLGRSGRLPVQAEFLSGRQVSLEENSRLIRGLRQGDAVIARVFCGCGHYILLTGEEGDAIRAFDPYRRETFADTDLYRRVDGHPYTHNHIIAKECFRPARDEGFFAFGPYERREAVILHRQPVSAAE